MYANNVGTNEEIQDVVATLGVTFPVLGKLSCASDNTHPLYVFLVNAIKVTHSFHQ